jgi:hypothetical protein
MVGVLPIEMLTAALAFASCSWRSAYLADHDHGD